LRLFYWGIDLATKADGDSTVVTILEAFENPEVRYQYKTVALKEIKGMDLQDQWDLVKRQAKVFPPARMKIDQTGLGTQFGQLAEREFGESVAEGIHMTMPNKDAIISNFRYFLEAAKTTGTRKLILPNNPTLINEVLSLQREISLTDVPKYHHPDADGAHDDYVWSLALACWGAKEAEGMDIAFGNLAMKPDKKKDFNPVGLAW
jgi:phage FluMu gp28-like protein